MMGAGSILEEETAKRIARQKLREKYSNRCEIAESKLETLVCGDQCNSMLEYFGFLQEKFQR